MTTLSVTRRGQYWTKLGNFYLIMILISASLSAMWKGGLWEVFRESLCLPHYGIRARGSNVHRVLQGYLHWRVSLSLSLNLQFFPNVILCHLYPLFATFSLTSLAHFFDARHPVVRQHILGDQNIMLTIGRNKEVKVKRFPVVDHIWGMKKLNIHLIGRRHTMYLACRFLIRINTYVLNNASQ